MTRSSKMSIATILCVLSLSLLLGLFAAEEPLETPAAPRVARVPPRVVPEAPPSCEMPTRPALASPGAVPQAEPPPAQPEWAGMEEMPSSGPHQVQELRPLNVPYARFAEHLASFFPYMNDEPPTPAHAVEYHQYAQNMMAQLHLGGDRANLELARLMLFDRLEASRPKLSMQEQMMEGFLSSVFAKQAPASEILGFVNEPGRNPEAPPRERSWDIGDKRLTVTVPEAYGMVVLLVTARG